MIVLVADGTDGVTVETLFVVIQVYVYIINIETHVPRTVRIGRTERGGPIFAVVVTEVDVLAIAEPCGRKEDAVPVRSLNL